MKSLIRTSIFALIVLFSGHSIQAQKKLVVVISNGLDNERASVAWSIASAGVKNEMDLTVLLVSSGVEWARKGAADHIQLNPVDPPIINMIQNVIQSGATIAACPPCLKLRGYEKEDLIEAVQISGAKTIFDPISDGASVLTF